MGTSLRTSGLPPVQTGILLIIATMFCLTAMDATVKSLSDSYSVVQLVWVRYFGQTLLVAVLFWRQLAFLFRTKHPALQTLRSLSLFFGTCLYFTGLSKVDLLSAATILQTSPFFIAALAHITLGERLGWQRILGIAIGLAGTLIIIRPGTSLFSPYALFPLGAAVCYGTFAVLTRRLSRDENIWSSFLFTTLAGAFVSTLIVPFNWQTPEISDLSWFVLAAVFGAAGHYLFIKAHFLAEATALAPFTYVSLIFAAVNGTVFFGDYPDLWTVTGAAAVVCSGLFVWYKETRQRLPH